MDFYSPDITAAIRLNRYSCLQHSHTGLHAIGGDGTG